ncbi:Nodule Cysteine-Rich (NCR) secreted peptide [Medicago truncatula]|uniref:Nodule Cysteine-Rich (NCR) secreted peptide n=1 Tax=Medicago truncatula TaxID=3880 RepID=G7KA19_MEDTR|nr:Nodule Cysteine-Rich (NCR) secreted peptide [Medicago truncatula]
MTTTLKFVYAIILFISLFLHALNAAENIECEVDADCPKSQVNSFVIKCIKNLCLYTKIHILYDTISKSESTLPQKKKKSNSTLTYFKEE